MNVMHKDGAPRYQRNNITSYLLVSAITGNAEQFAITLVEMEPGGIQHVHDHAPEQTYYILEGHGLMTVNDEQREVHAGDCIYFPSFARHGLQNTGESILRYLSAASPSFSREQCQQLWPLKSLDEERQQDKETT